MSTYYEQVAVLGTEKHLLSKAKSTSPLVDLSSLVKTGVIERDRIREWKNGIELGG